jgi:hypothetical protein
MPQEITASFDGACEPCNPGGHVGLGWVIDGAPHHEYVPAAYGNTNIVAESGTEEVYRSWAAEWVTLSVNRPTFVH